MMKRLPTLIAALVASAFLFQAPCSAQTQYNFTWTDVQGYWISSTLVSADGNVQSPNGDVDGELIVLWSNAGTSDERSGASTIAANGDFFLNAPLVGSNPPPILCALVAFDDNDGYDVTFVEAEGS